MWTWLNKVVSRLRRDTVTTKIRLADERIIVERSNLDAPFSFRWSDIDEIQTFKLDLLTTDDIRLAFRVSDMWYEFSESDDGFMSLTEAMQTRFPEIHQDWYMEVMQPAFATNQRTLWKRG